MGRREQHDDGRPPKPFHGFTLIELLVVISIVAALTAILLPALRKAKESAQIAQCGSNLRQLGIAFHTYAMDSDDWLPHIGVQQHGIPHTGQWYLFYHPYLSTAKLTSTNPTDVGLANPVFDCPTTPTDIKPFDYFSGYAHTESNGTGHGLAGKKIHELRGDTFLLIDHEANVTGWNWQSSPGGPFWNVFYPGFWYLGSPWLPGYHHNNGANILYPDSHVRLHAREDYQPDWAGGNLWMKEYLTQQ